MTHGLVPCSLPMRFKLPNTDKYAIAGHAMSKMRRDLLLTLNTTTLQYELKHCHRTQTTINNLRTATLRPYPQEIPYNTILIMKATFMAYVVAEHEGTIKDYYAIHPLGMEPTIDCYTWETLPLNQNFCILGLDSIHLRRMLQPLSNDPITYQLIDYQSINYFFLACSFFRLKISSRFFFSNSFTEGPYKTSPCILKRLPWQGQSQLFSA